MKYGGGCLILAILVLFVKHDPLKRKGRGAAPYGTGTDRARGRFARLPQKLFGQATQLVFVLGVLDALQAKMQRLL